jgi:hypothetical protein
MQRRYGVVLLAAVAVATVAVLPAHASSKSVHRIMRSSVRALRAPQRADAAVAKPDIPAIAWTPAATLPAGVAETGGGAALAAKFYVIGGYDSAGETGAVQIYNKASNSWTTDTADPVPSGTLVDSAFCTNPADHTIHAVNGGIGGLLASAHQVYNPAGPAGSRWTIAAAPIVGATTFFSQDSGCAFIGGKMYLWGGYGVYTTTDIQRITLVYDPATDTWADTGKLMVQGELWSGHTSNTTTAYDAGGTHDLSTFAADKNTESFKPATGWAAGAMLPVALLGPAEGLISTHLLVWGGDAPTGFSNKSYHCVLPACTSWSALPANVPSAKAFTAWGSGTSLFNGGGYDAAFAVQNTAEHLP